MANFKIPLALALLAVVASAFADSPSTNASGDLPKPSYARTMLKVSRSLPGETEEVKVRTSEGNVATLIVKRREKSVSNSLQNINISNNNDNGERKDENKNVSVSDFSTPSRESPFESSSTRTTTTTPTTKAPYTPTTIGYQNVEVDPWNRLQTWSSVSSDVAETNQEDESRNWVPLSRGFDSWKPVEPVATLYNTESPRRTSWLVADHVLDGSSTRSFQTVPADNDSNERIIRYTFLPHEPVHPRRTRTNIGANLMKNRDAKNVPAEVVVRSEINVKPQPGQQQPQSQPQSQLQMQPKRLPMISLDADGTPVVHGRRVPDEPIDRYQVWRNARVINDQLVTDPTTSTTSTTTTGTTSTARGTTESKQSFERFFEDVNRRYGKNPEDGSGIPKTYRNEVLAAEIYETAEETYRPSIRKRMLQPEISPIYPNSRVYSPPDLQKLAAVVPSVKPGTRAPVLQYAHPELGVQPAKVVKNEKRRIEEVTEASTVNPMRHQQQYAYQNQQQSQMQQQQQQQQQYHYGEHRQKKKYVLNDKNIVDSYTYKNYYPNQHFYGLKRPEAPFWVKISENLKNQFTDSVAKVSELTKPVFDPLVEATRKISENLGLSSSRSQDPAQDKLGSVAAATGSSVLIPALGLMASGAALGIGAVAVGRYLDVDVLKRSNDGSAPLVITGSDAESQRALGIISELQRGEEAAEARVEPEGERNVYILVQEDRQNEGLNRRKRSIDAADGDSRRMQRKGADSIAEIVEIDVPSRLADDATANDVHLENEEAFAKALIEQTLEAIAAGSQTQQVEKQKQSEEVEKTRTRRRRRRSTSEDELADALQSLEVAELAEAGVGHVPGDWTNTPCAKRIFCDAMLKRGTDAHMLMEKRMSGLLRMIQPVAAVQVSAHFDEVMDAVRRHDCSLFSCPRARPVVGGLFV